MNRAVKASLVVLQAVLCLVSQSVFAQAGSSPELIEAAKKEGALGYYTTMTLSQSKKLVDRFEQKYPPIKVELFRTGGDPLLNKITTAGGRFGLPQFGLPGLLSALRHHLHHHGGPCD